MVTINLEDLQFYSFHGLHEEERILGNKFVVKVALSVETGNKIIAIDQTIDYELLYMIIKTRMQQPTPLLETLAGDLTDTIIAFDKRIKNVSVTIQKKYLPIAGTEGSVSVSCSKES